MRGWCQSIMKELSLHILDIVQNSVRASAKDIVVSIEISEGVQRIVIQDNGKGIAPEMLETIKNPYTTSRTMRNVGLGIPLFNDTCRLCNGHLSIESQVGIGTTLTAVMENDHIDKPPMGDIGGTMSGIMSSYPDINIIFTYRVGQASFDISTQMIQEELEDVSIQSVEVVSWIREFINENISEINER